MITRDSAGKVILIESPTMTLRESAGIWYLVADDGEGGEYRARIDPELGLSAWHRPPERPVEPAEATKPLPNNILPWPVAGE